MALFFGVFGGGGQIGEVGVGELVEEGYFALASYQAGGINRWEAGG